MLPMLIFLVLNAINFGYFFLVALNLAAAPRSGVEYAMLGSATPGNLTLPSAGPSTTTTSVSYLVYQDMTGALFNPTGATVQVCSETLGLNNAGASNQTAKCSSFGSGTSWTPASDPESPYFILHRVDVSYTFSPLVQGTVFNAPLVAASVCSSSSGSVTCTFHRQVSMRAMN